MKTEMLAAKDGKQLALYIWDKVEKPVGVLQLVHGMCEHSARYDDFGNFLNENNIILAMNDLRGHGKTAEKNSLGYESGDMWSNNISDQIMLSEKLKERFSLPVVLMGHSYGSFLAQSLISLNPHPIAFVLSGSNYMKGFLYTMGGLISHLAKTLKGGEKPCKLMAKMSFSSYEKKIPGTNCWLSRDEAVVDEYNADYACGYVASNNFYATFMDGIKGLYSSKASQSIDRQKPIYIFSGDNDPVGEYGKGVGKLYEYYKQLGCLVNMKLYPLGRHEMLNEINKKEVYLDLLTFLVEQFLKSAVEG